MHQSTRAVVSVVLLSLLTGCSSSSSDPAPVLAFTSGATGSIAENATLTGYTAATSGPGSATATYSLTGGADQSELSIDANTGSLSFQSSPDFESPDDDNSDNGYEVEITATTSGGSIAQTVTIMVTGVNDNAPFFQSGTSASAAENSTATGYTAMATDADNDSVSYTLTGGADLSKFNIDANSGVLTFAAAPDFETPTDANTDNTYEIEISATDGTLQTARTVSVQLTGTNDNTPVFTSATSATLDENNAATGYTATATDADLDTPTFSLTGGADQAKFSIDGNSGVLSFLAAPDFESPTDADTNNTYVVQITATDTLNTAALTVTLTIADILEATFSTADMKVLQVDWAAFPGASFYRLLVDPDGASGFSLLQNSLTGTSTTFEISVHLVDWVNARYILEAHDGSGKLSETVPLSVTAEMLNTIGYFKASNPDNWDTFGGALWISEDGQTMAVGAMAEDSDGSSETDNSISGSGAVYIFARSGNTWSQQAYIKPGSPMSSASYGFQVRLSSDGNTLAVGSPGEDSSATGIDGNEVDTAANSAGAVFVYTRSGTTWTQEAYVKASNTGAGDRFGLGLALSSDGNTLAVGADEEASNDTGVGGAGTDNSVLRSGACYVFTRSGTTWTQQEYIKASNTGADDHFGVALALSSTGDTLAVGAKLEASNATTIGGLQSDDSALGAGAVYIFTRSGISWSQEEYIKASNAEGWDTFGTSLSLSGDGNTLAVGADGEDGSSTGIDGNEASNLVDNAGAAYLFTRSGTVWTQAAYVKPSNPGNSDEFGLRLALSSDGSTLAVSSPSEDSDATGVGGSEFDAILNSGAVYVFTNSAGTWSQSTYLKASNSGAEDKFGSALGLVSDGSVLAVGANWEWGSATGVGGDETDNGAQAAGAVFLY